MSTMKKRIHKTIVSAMFASLVCVATMLIKIPVPATNGYIHTGDCIVLISGWLLGGVYGTLAAGIGSALADILLAYPLYVPGTFVIKALVALTALVIYKLLHAKINRFFAYALSSVVAEAVMVAGYFVYEALFLSYGIGAAASIPANLIQGAGGVLISVVIMGLIKDNKYIKNFMGFDA